MLEKNFRSSKVNPFLKTLKNSWFASVQQQSINGTPDKLGVCAGRFVALELKSDKGKLSALQKYTLDLIESSGGIALVASPNNWESIKKTLITLDRGE